MRGGLTGPGRGATWLVGVFLFVVAMAQVSWAITINGWDYTDSRLTDAEVAARFATYHVGNFQYDQYGRIIAYTSDNGSGTIEYINAVYDANGNLVSATMVINGIPDSPHRIAQAATVNPVAQAAATDIAVSAAKAQLQQSQEIVSANIMRTERRTVEGSLYNHLRLALIPGFIGNPANTASAPLTGVASGDAAGGLSPVWSMWVDGSITSLGGNRSGYQSDGTNYMTLAGVECAVSDRFVVGLGFGYSRVDTTYFNGSGLAQHDNGFILNPYLGYSPIENLLFSVQGGLTFTNTSLNGQRTIVNMFGTRSTLSYDSSYGGLTASVGADVSYAIVLNRLVITPHAGYSYSSRQCYGTNTKGVEQGILAAGGMVGYNFDKLTPFVSATYNYDTIGQTKLQRDDMQGVAGLSYRPTDRFQATASVTNAFFRYKEYETTFDLNLRYTF